MLRWRWEGASGYPGAESDVRVLFLGVRGGRVCDVRQAVDRHAGADAVFLFSFCALWLSSAKLYEKCYAVPPVFGRACGDAQCSTVEKVDMLRDVRDGLPGGVAAAVEPVKLVIEQIVCVVLEAQEKLARRDEAATGKRRAPRM